MEESEIRILRILGVLNASSMNGHLEPGLIQRLTDGEFYWRMMNHRVLGGAPGSGNRLFGSRYEEARADDVVIQNTSYFPLEVIVSCCSVYDLTLFTLAHDVNKTVSFVLQ